MLKKILTGAAVIVLLFVVVGFFLSDHYAVSRSAVMKAPADVVFRHVNHMERMQAWSPWKQTDPTVKPVMGAILEGKGASYSWTSEKSGNGTLRILESVPSSRIVNELDFGSDGKAQATWTFTAVDGGTSVKWGFEGNAEGSIPGRYFGLLMDAMVGGHFESGLALLKGIAEAEAAALPAPEPDAAPAADAPSAL